MCFVNILSNVYCLRKCHSLHLRGWEMQYFSDRLKLPLPLNTVLLNFCLERDHWNSKIPLGPKYNIILDYMKYRLNSRYSKKQNETCKKAKWNVKFCQWNLCFSLDQHSFSSSISLLDEGKEHNSNSIPNGPQMIC